MRRRLSEETKKKLSEIAKERHRSGSLKSLGHNTKGRKYRDEECFNGIVMSEFEDKEFKREYQVSVYKIDFAWVKKRLAIEIDGEQHYRFEYYIENDRKKDEYLKTLGWEVLRIDTRDLRENKEAVIKRAKEFVSSRDAIYIEKEKKDRVRFGNSKLYGKYLRDRAIEKHKPVIDLIINSGIDFSKFGWVEKISTLTGKKTEKVNEFMRKFIYDFWLKSCYKRKGTKLDRL